MKKQGCFFVTCFHFPDIDFLNIMGHGTRSSGPVWQVNLGGLCFLERNLDTMFGFGHRPKRLENVEASDTASNYHPFSGAEPCAVAFS